MGEKIPFLENIDVKFFDSIRYRNSVSNGVVINALHEYDRVAKKLYIYIDRNSTNVYVKRGTDGAMITVDDVVFKVQGVDYTGSQLLTSEDGNSIVLELLIEDSIIKKDTGFYVFVETTIDDVYRDSDVFYIPNDETVNIFSYASALKGL